MLRLQSTIGKRTDMLLTLNPEEVPDADAVEHHLQDVNCKEEDPLEQILCTLIDYDWEEERKRQCKYVDPRQLCDSKKCLPARCKCPLIHSDATFVTTEAQLTTQLEEISAMEKNLEEISAMEKNLEAKKNLEAISAMDSLKRDLLRCDKCDKWSVTYPQMDSQLCWECEEEEQHTSWWWSSEEEEEEDDEEDDEEETASEKEEEEEDVNPFHNYDGAAYNCWIQLDLAVKRPIRCEDLHEWPTDLETATDRRIVHPISDLHLPVCVGGTRRFTLMKTGGENVNDRMKNDRLWFTEAEGRTIVSNRNHAVGARKRKATTEVPRKEVARSEATERGKKKKWQRRPVSHRYGSRSSSNPSCEFTWPTEWPQEYDDERKRYMNRFICPFDDCLKNVKSMKSKGKMHDFQKGNNLKRHMVSFHPNCRLLDKQGKLISKYKYKCWDDHCLQKIRIVEGRQVVGIKPFHDITQYRRHLRDVHHRIIVKTDGTFHVQGYRDHIISENYEQVTDRCKWWEQPKDCSCWNVRDDCDCENCRNRKYKRRKLKKS
jgi:hypothetical protein